MYVTQLSEVINDRALEIENPTWDQIEQAIRRLDGDIATEVFLGPGRNHPCMGVAGGGETGCIVIVMHDDTNAHNLIDPKKSHEQLLLIAGGQEGYFEERSCMDLASTLRAARTYAESGTLEPSLSWEEGYT